MNRKRNTPKTQVTTADGGKSLNINFSRIVCFGLWVLNSRVDRLIRWSWGPCDRYGRSGHSGKHKRTVAAGDLTQVSLLYTNQLKGTDCHGFRCRKLQHKNPLGDTGAEGRNSKINIRETWYKTEECIRQALLHGPVTGSCQNGNEHSFSTTGVIVPN
jgi:hypothetical protein